MLWGAGTAIDAAVPNSGPGSDLSTSGASYKLEDIKFTISKRIFNDPLYFNLRASKMLCSRLQIGYQTYVTSKQASFTKDTSVNVLTTVNTTLLDQIICCLQPSNTTISKLQLSKTFNEVFSSAYTGQNSTGSENSIAAGDLYNQSIYFKSDATGLISSSLEINNTSLMP